MIRILLFGTLGWRNADLPGQARLALQQTLAHGSVFEAVRQPEHPRAPYVW